MASTSCEIEDGCPHNRATQRQNNWLVRWTPILGTPNGARFSQPAYLVGYPVGCSRPTLGSALSVVRHADRLAVRLAEPYGTLILTLSITVIEVASIGCHRFMTGGNASAIVYWLVCSLFPRSPMVKKWH
jgi:hypothetical protein